MNYPDALLVGLVVLAIALGWLLGRRELRKKGSPDTAGVHYIKGLNYFLNEQPDKAVELFVDMLEVNSDTAEMHLAMGKLFRKRGEVDKAIRIHQNLLARSGWKNQFQDAVQIELARDFLAAGVLDRAELLLQQLIDSNSAISNQAQHMLLHIFEQEKDWANAIAIAEVLALKNPKINRALAHYCCELTQSAIKQGEVAVARRTLKRALSYDKQCARASLLLGEIEYNQSNYRESIRAYRKVRHQSPPLLPETINGLSRCYNNLNDQAGFVNYLSKCVKESPTISVVLKLADLVKELSGEKEASQIIAQYIKSNPSVRGVHHLIEMNVGQSVGQARENLTILQQMVERLLADKPVYQCQHCGFNGKSLHWLCPSCKSWGQVYPIQGLEGE